MIIGVDRQDYSKRLVARFRAFEKLLATDASIRSNVTLMQIAPPSTYSPSPTTQPRIERRSSEPRIERSYSAPQTRAQPRVERSFSPPQRHSQPQAQPRSEPRSHGGSRGEGRASSHMRGERGGGRER